MTILSVRKFFAAAVMVACLPLAPHTASAASAANLPDFTDLVDKVGPAVVNIRTTAKVSNSTRGLPPGMDDGDMSEFFRRFFGIPMPNSPQSPGTPNSPRGGGGGGGGNSDQDQAPDSGNDTEQNSGVGSGFILSADGYVMTNAHVIDDADTIYVTLTDKREFKAKLIGSDQRTDVAVVKIEATGLPFVKVGDVDKAKVGEWVIAIGSPYGLESTVTAGIISAKQRETGDYLLALSADSKILEVDANGGR